jgi:hypothetical protein
VRAGTGEAGTPPPFLILAARAEEVLEEAGGLGGQGAFDDFDAVVEEVGVGDLKLGADAAEADVAGGEDEGADAGVDEGAGAHDAGLQGGVDGGVVEAVVGAGLGSGAEEVHFGVGGGVMGSNGGVVGAGDDLAVEDKDGADGDFAFGFGLAGLFEGEAHVVVVMQAALIGPDGFQLRPV